MIYRCRATAPLLSAWYDTEAPSPEEAANAFHVDRLRKIESMWIWHDGASVAFVKIEVDGHGELVSRVYSHQIRRKGGVEPERRSTIQEIARRLGWTHAPEDLLADGWVCEESMEKARERKWGNVEAKKQ